MAKFRRKPPEVDAYQNDGTPEFVAMLNDRFCCMPHPPQAIDFGNGHVTIFGGSLPLITVTAGEWVVAKQDGKVFSLTAAAFKAIYEPME